MHLANQTHIGTLRANQDKIDAYKSKLGLKAPPGLPMGVVLECDSLPNLTDMHGVMTRDEEDDQEPYGGPSKLPAGACKDVPVWYVNTPFC